MPYQSHQSILNLPHWHFFPRKKEAPLPGLTGLYLNASLRTFGLSLISIFIPLYILKITSNLNWVFIFYIVSFGIMSFLDYILAKVVSKIGPDWSALISNLFLISYLICLKAAKMDLNFFLLAALMIAFVVPLYWGPYHLAFINLGKQEKMGGQVTIMVFFSRVVASLAPVCGGLIIKNWGFDVLFNIALGIIFFSVFPLFFDSYNKKESISSFGKIISSILSREERHNVLGFVGESIETFIAVVFWPIVIFLSVGSYQIVGLITSASLLFSLIILMILKKYIDRREKRFFRWGMWGNGLNWLVRIFANGARQIFLADLSYNLLALFVWTPFHSLVYKKAKSKKIFDFVELREIVFHSTRMFAGIIIAWVWWWTKSMFLVFVFAILGLFLAQFLVREDAKP